MRFVDSVFIHRYDFLCVIILCHPSSQLSIIWQRADAWVLHFLPLFVVSWVVRVWGGNHTRIRATNASVELVEFPYRVFVNVPADSCRSCSSAAGWSGQICNENPSDPNNDLFIEGYTFSTGHPPLSYFPLSLLYRVRNRPRFKAVLATDFALIHHHWLCVETWGG